MFARFVKYMSTLGFCRDDDDDDELDTVRASMMLVLEGATG